MGIVKVFLHPMLPDHVNVVNIKKSSSSSLIKVGRLEMNENETAKEKTISFAVILLRYFPSVELCERKWSRGKTWILYRKSVAVNDRAAEGGVFTLLLLLRWRSVTAEMWRILRTADWDQRRNVRPAIMATTLPWRKHETCNVILLSFPSLCHHLQWATHWNGPS